MDQMMPVARRAHVDDDHVLVGVAGHLARILGIDALWTRLGFVLLTLVGGLGVVLYAGLWLVLSANREVRGHWRRVAGVLLLVAGAPILLFVQVGTRLPLPVVVVLLLAGLAVALWRTSGSTTVLDPATIDPATIDPAAAADPTSIEPTPTPTGPGRSRPRFRRPERSPLGRTALGIAIAAAAIGALIDQANGGRLHPEQWLGAAAAVCGAGLLVGTVRGRGRWLIVPALLFAGSGYVVGTSARLGIAAADTFGTRWVWVGSGTASRQVARTTFGDVEIQIERQAADADAVTVDARTGFGDVRVWTDDGVPVEVRSRLDGGAVWLNGRRVEGTGAVRIGPAGAPAVIVDARVGRGDVRIDTHALAALVPMTVPLASLPESGLPGDASMTAVADGVSATADGWFVLGGGIAVIDDQDELVTGEMYDDGNGGSVVMTEFGEFRLLPRGLLVTPYGQVIDLRAVRAELAPRQVPGLVPPDGSLPTLPPAEHPATVPDHPTLGG